MSIWNSIFKQLATNTAYPDPDPKVTTAPPQSSDDDDDKTEWCFTPGCGDSAILEYSGKVVQGFLGAAKDTVVDTGARVADLATQGTAALVKADTFGLVELPYTEWSPEAKRYDENLSYADNLRKTRDETKAGVQAFAKGVATGQPDAVGALGFVVATSVAGDPPNLPTLPFIPMPQFATSVLTNGERVSSLALEGTAIGTSTVAKFGAPLLAVMATGGKDGKNTPTEPTKAQNDGTPAPAKGRAARISDLTDEQRIRQVDEWNKKGKFPGDPKGLKQRLQLGDPKAREEFDGIKSDIEKSKRPGMGESRRGQRAAVQRMSDSNKTELENSGWLKRELQSGPSRKEFMKWLEDNHRQGEPHIHVRPGSREAEEALKRFSEETGTALDHRR